MAPLALKQQRSIVSSSSRRAVVARRPVVAVRAAAQLPAGVSRPAKQPQTPEPRFGFVYNAERLNSRACMMGFIGTLLVEAIAHRGVLEMVGLKIGNGLGFEF